MVICFWVQVVVLAHGCFHQYLLFTIFGINDFISIFHISHLIRIYTQWIKYAMGKIHKLDLKIAPPPLKTVYHSHTLSNDSCRPVPGPACVTPLVLHGFVFPRQQKTTPRPMRFGETGLAEYRARAPISFFALCHGPTCMHVSVCPTRRLVWLQLELELRIESRRSKLQRSGQGCDESSLAGSFRAGRSAQVPQTVRRFITRPCLSSKRCSQRSECIVRWTMFTIPFFSLFNENTGLCLYRILS